MAKIKTYSYSATAIIPASAGGGVGARGGATGATGAYYRSSIQKYVMRESVNLLGAAEVEAEAEVVEAEVVVQPLLPAQQFPLPLAYEQSQHS